MKKLVFHVYKKANNTFFYIFSVYINMDIINKTKKGFKKGL